MNPLDVAIYFSLQTIGQTYPIALSDLVKKCKNPSYTFPPLPGVPSSVSILQRYALLDSQSQVIPEVAAIALQHFAHIDSRIENTFTACYGEKPQPK